MRTSTRTTGIFAAAVLSLGLMAGPASALTASASAPTAHMLPAPGGNPTPVPNKHDRNHIPFHCCFDKPTTGHAPKNVPPPWETVAASA